ncbi:MAG: hypothetical protein KDE55_00980 [Novosphingobium sp.]|nr:hypothetical protein [Novosphingobium sp.]
MIQTGMEPQLGSQLADPSFRKSYLTAFAVLEKLGRTRWYDAHFLYQFEAAKMFLQAVRPDEVERFVSAFEPLRTRADFQVCRFSNVLDDEAVQQATDLIRGLTTEQLKSFAMEGFGRSFLHNHPQFAALHESMAAIVSQAAGETVEPSYTYLSLYNRDGVCPLHLDAPDAKWTLDICIDTDVDWPIHISRVGDWPDVSEFASWNGEQGQLPSHREFAEQVLRYNEAILFSGSAQWHYRETIPADGHCHLLFLHYHPAGCGPLVRPREWAGHFELPELAVLIDLYDQWRMEAVGPRYPDRPT